MKTDWKTEWKSLAWMVALFLGFYALPLDWPRFQAGLAEGLALTQWYAREHVLLCLVPAFFIAGAIATFVRQESVMRYLGPQASKPLAYGVASVSGTILAVCSCTVLPLFAGIWRMGAGLGPAIAFLYSGPAISALAIILTARVLGLEMGVARSVGAILFSLLIGWLMALAFRKEELAKAQAAAASYDPGPPQRHLWKTSVWIGLMVALLIFANWNETEKENAFFAWVSAWKWGWVSLAASGMALAMVRWFAAPLWKVGAAAAATVAAAWIWPGHVAPFSVGTVALAWISSTSEGELGDWFYASWDFAKMITPLLLGGVFVSGMLLGRPGHEALIPSEWVASSVGGNSIGAIFFSSVVGALMYFATLTEVPILQGLIGSGMGKGPALALLLAGPALSLPSMIALWKIMGGGRTLLYCGLVVMMATLTGWIYGSLF